MMKKAFDETSGSLSIKSERETGYTVIIKDKSGTRQSSVKGKDIKYQTQ